MNRRPLIAALAGIGIAVGAVLAGCGGGSSTTATPIPARVELTPACSDPARLERTWDPRTPLFIVKLNDDRVPLGPRSRETTLQLAAKYGFTPEHIYDAVLNGFAAPLTPEQVAQLRCDPDIDYLAYNVLGGGIPPMR
jgi:hypothetical protein